MMEDDDGFQSASKPRKHRLDPRICLGRLPPGVDRDEAIAFNEHMARRDGIANIDDDGTVHFTEHAVKALSGIDPVLVEPLAPDEAWSRFERLEAALRR